MKKYLVYGAGEIAKHWLSKNNEIIPEFILETVTKSSKKSLLGIPVLAPEAISNPKDFEVLVSVTTTKFQTFRNSNNLLFGDDLAKYLYGLGFSKVHSFEESCMLFPKFIENIPPGGYLWLNDINGKSVGNIDLDNSNKIELLRQNLLDAQSKMILDVLLEFRKNLNFKNYPLPETTSKQYLDPIFLSKIPDKVNILDLGGFNGDSAEDFILELDDKIASIFIAEPSRVNLDELEFFRKTRKIFQEKIVPILCAVGNSNGLALISGHGPSARVESYNQNLFVEGSANMSVVPLCTIDDHFFDLNINIVKMDIEGSEISALQGAKRFIKDKSPYLAIAGYHKATDLYEIPEIILNINSNYKFILRIYGHMAKELVIYCVPII